MDIGTMVADLIEAGCSPEVAATVVTRAFVAGANSTGIRGNPVDSAAEKRRAYDRERKRNSTGIPPESADTPVLYRDTKIKNSKRQNSERASRGTRIDPQWSPSPADRQVASDEGLSASEIDREALRFRDYWAGRAGSGGVKLDWAATWRNWVRSTAEKLGKTPLASSQAPSAETGFVAKAMSEELEAWDEYGRTTTGKSFPRNREGGWRFPTQWPPGYQRKQLLNESAPPLALRSMQ